ncbi:hypothetical protein pb186bvf_019458 [Paramecium bursaria]
MKESKKFDQITLSSRRQHLKTPQVDSGLLTSRSETKTLHEVQLKRNSYFDDFKKLLKTEADEKELQRQDSRLKNWNVVFGDFLSDISLRKRQATRKQTELQVDPALLKEVPFPMINNIWKSPSTKKSFSQFLLGQISAEEFLKQKNRSELRDRQTLKTEDGRKSKINLARFEKKIEENIGKRRQGVSDGKFIGMLNNKSNELLKKLKISNRFDKIRNVIEEKIHVRELEDLAKRRKDLQNLLVFKHMYDISDDYISQIRTRIQEQDEPRQKYIKKCGQGIQVMKHENPYQEIKSARYINEDKPKYDNPVDQRYIKMHIDEKAKDYLRCLEDKEFQDNEKINKRIFFNFKKDQRIKNKESNMVAKKEYNDRDVELIKYIKNFPKQDPKKDKQLQEQARQTLTDVEHLFKQKKASQPALKLNEKLRYNTCSSDDSMRSNNESLFSMYEFNVESLYEQSKQVQKKLLEKQHTDGFGKTIRQIQKNENIKQEILLKNISKLEGLKPI